MSYKEALFRGIGGRICTILLLVLGLVLMPKDQNSWSVAFVFILFIVIGAGNIFQIINYLSMDREELVAQVEWEFNK